MSEKSTKNIKNTCKTNIYKFRANSKKAQQVNPSPFKSAQVPWTYFLKNLTDNHYNTIPYHVLQIVDEIEETFLEKLGACGEDDGCRAMLLRALSNAGLPGTIPVLLQHAENAKQAVISEAAVKALRRMDKQYITAEVREHFNGIGREGLMFISMGILAEK